MSYPCPNCGGQRAEADSSCEDCGWERKRSDEKTRDYSEQLSIGGAIWRGARTGFVWVASFTFCLGVAAWLAAVVGLIEGADFGSAPIAMLGCGIAAIQTGFLGAIAGAMIFPLSLYLRDAPTGTKVISGLILGLITIAIGCMVVATLH